MDPKLQYDVDSDDSSGERQLHILPPLSLPAAKSRKTKRHHSNALLAKNNTERVQAKHQRTAGRNAKRQAGQFFLTLPFVNSRPVAPEKKQ